MKFQLFICMRENALQQTLTKDTLTHSFQQTDTLTNRTSYVSHKLVEREGGANSIPIKTSPYHPSFNDVVPQNTPLQQRVLDYR